GALGMSEPDAQAVEEEVRHYGGAGGHAACDFEGAVAGAEGAAAPRDEARMRAVRREPDAEGDGEAGVDPPRESGVRPADVARVADEEGAADVRPRDAVVRRFGRGRRVALQGAGRAQVPRE